MVFDRRKASIRSRTGAGWEVHKRRKWSYPSGGSGAPSNPPRPAVPSASYQFASGPAPRIRPAPGACRHGEQQFVVLAAVQRLFQRRSRIHRRGRNLARAVPTPRTAGAGRARGRRSDPSPPSRATCRAGTGRAPGAAPDADAVSTPCRAPTPVPAPNRPAHRRHRSRRRRARRRGAAPSRAVRPRNHDVAHHLIGPARSPPISGVPARPASASSPS